MKSLICYLVLIFSTFVLRAQTTYPLTQNIGSPITKVTIPNYGAYYGGLIPLKFADTSAANTALTYGKNYDGFLIMTLSPPALWWRYYTDSTKWVQILPSGSSGGTLAWVMGGNNPVVTDVSLYGLLGTKPNNGLSLITNNIVRFSINTSGAFGIGSGRDFGTSGYLLQSNGSGSAPSWVSTSGLSGWSLTGNAGTTAGTNFIGTTDNVDFVFKRSNVESGRISTGNASFGYQALMNNSGSNSNTAFGVSALLNTTTGVDNTAVGVSALSSAITADFNTAVGSLSAGNTTGSENTAIGFQSLGINDVGTNNISVGAYAGANVQTLSNRVYINSINRGSDQFDTTKSIIYGAQDATASSQRLYLNSQVYMPYINSGAGTKALRINPGTGIITYADTSTASGTVTGTGTANTMTKWTGTSAIGNSGTTADGTNVTMTENLLFSTDNTKDIGASGATRPRTLYFGTSIVGGTGSTINATKFNATATSSADVTYLATGNVTSGALFRGVNSGTVFEVSATGALTAATSVTSPLLIGGTGTTSSLTYKTTTGVGTTGADHIFQVGNNGATEAMRILNSGAVAFNGSTPTSTYKMYLSDAGNTANQAYIAGLTIGTDGNGSKITTATNNMTVSGAIFSFQPSTGLSIGTYTPSAKLHVLSTTEQLRLGYDASNYNSFTTTSAGNLLIGISGTNKWGLSNGDGGTLYAVTGGTYNIGFDGSNAPKTIYAGSSTGTNAFKGWLSDNTTSSLTNAVSTLVLQNNDVTTNNFVKFGLNSLDNGATARNAALIGAQVTARAAGSITADLVFATANAGAAAEVVRFTSAGNVGIGTTSPNSTLHTNGSFATAYRAITALRTLDGTDYTIEVTANTFTVTLPTAVGITGRIYVITNSGSGVTTVGTTSSQTFANVLTTPTTLSLAQYSTVMVQSNGANWLRLTNL